MKLNRIAFGIGFCPFDWRVGDASVGWECMWALGPFRISWRGW